ncbi:MAG: fasciclin domain-containing protein [Planctomycetota bacterium]|jgi:uncharacterized surface protein with fasciclin (FAS1) repeats|nr:fasciclin domain-containing protein [Planctomycetota bacterium]
MVRSLVAAFAIVALMTVSRAQAEEKTIVGIAVGADNFKTLVAALKAADLVEALDGKGPFTVFAPTDAAFEKLGKETIEAVLKDKEKLTSILKYHVVSGKVMAADAIKLDGKDAKTLSGKTFKIEVVDGGVVLNGKVKVIKTDIKASNGVIHVIDAVLLP